MTHSSTYRSLRVALVAVALALATTIGAAADVLVPASDVGASGGGGGFAGQLDESARGQDLGALTGGGGFASGDAPTQNELSVQRIESTQTADGSFAGGESRAPQATSPLQIFF